MAIPLLMFTAIEGNQVKKQVIVMRSDLGMRKGKMIAQGAHASMKVLLDAGSFARDSDSRYAPLLFSIVIDNNWEDWLNGAFTKICVRCDSEADLLALYEEAKAAKLPCSLITDSGATEFNGVPTNTCIAIGPAEALAIDSITGKLKLF